MNSVKEYKCLNCNAPLEFYPPSQNWKCHFCSSEYTKDKLEAAFQREELTCEDMQELDSYRCTACGGELIADSNTAATFCLYCGNPAIIKSRFAGRFKPKSLIPFKITRKQAEDIYKKWIRKRRFAPGEFKQKEKIEKITGIYAPFWLFDCKAGGMIDGEATRVRTWTSGKYRYTQTMVFRVTRQGSAEYRMVPVDASKKLDDTFMNMIEPYDYNELTDFSMKYMSGFMAEKYDVEAPEAVVVMKDRVEKYMEDRLRGTAEGYSAYTVSQRQMELYDTLQDYSMLPIYLLINKYKGKDHVFIVNGQTGKVVGNTPVSRMKQILFAASVFASVWAAAVFGGALFV